MKGEAVPTNAPFEFVPFNRKKAILEALWRLFSHVSLATRILQEGWESEYLAKGNE